MISDSGLVDGFVGVRGFVVVGYCVWVHVGGCLC